MSIYKQPPCYEDGKPCEKRHVGCHSKCKEFIDWKKARDEELDKKRKSDELRHQLDDTNIQRIRKIKEGRRRR